MTTPSEVADSMMAISSGAFVSPEVSSTTPASTASANEIRKPSPATRSRRPRNCSNSTSRPARRSRNARPISDITSIGRSTCTQSSAAGPSTISSTTAGRRTAGTSPSTSGAANATPATIASPEKETLIPLRPRSGCTRYKGARRARKTRTRPARLRRRTGLPDPGTDCPKSTGRERLIFPGGAAPLPARRGRSSRRGAVRRRRALDRRGRRRPQRVVLRPDRPVSLSGTRLHVRGRLHDRGPPDPRLGAVRRPQPPASRRPGEAGRAQSADCRIRAAFRPERLVLRLGGGRRARPRSPRTLIEQHFDRSLTVGVEEEVWILDAETLELVPRVETLVAGAEGRNLPGVLKTELHATVVELTSDVSDSAEEAVDKLEALRVAAEEIAK